MSPMKAKTESVKIGSEEYRKIKAMALRRGQFAVFVLNQAIREYLAAEKVKP